MKHNAALRNESQIHSFVTQRLYVLRVLGGGIGGRYWGADGRGRGPRGNITNREGRNEIKTILGNIGDRCMQSYLSVSQSVSQSVSKQASKQVSK